MRDAALDVGCSSIDFSLPAAIPVNSRPKHFLL